MITIPRGRVPSRALASRPLPGTIDLVVYGPRAHAELEASFDAPLAKVIPFPSLAASGPPPDGPSGPGGGGRRTVVRIRQRRGQRAA